MLKFEAKYIAIYTAPEWTWELVTALKKTNGDFKKAMKEIMKKGEMKKRGKQIASMLKKLMEKDFYKELPAEPLNENKLLSDAKEFLEREIGLPLKINPQEDPAGRAKRALPGKPAIYIAPKEE